MCIDCSCQKVALIFGIIWSSIILMAVIFVAFSFSSVKLNQVGLKYDLMNQDYDKSNIYLNGRHWVGFGSRMEVFDIDYKEINFNKDNLGYIITKTSDPSEIYIEVFIMYRLRSEFLLEIFRSYPDMDYEYSFNLIAKDAILDIANKFSIYDYMKNRTLISEAFLESVNKAFRNVYIELVLFELGEIKFYDSFEQEIIKNLKSMNDAVVQNFENTLSVRKGNLDNLYSNMNLEINKILYDADYKRQIMYDNVESKYLSEKIESESNVLKQFMNINNLRFNSKEITKLILFEKIDYETFFGNETIFKNDLSYFSDKFTFDDLSFGSNKIEIDR
jgi:hypothetical protein